MTIPDYKAVFPLADYDHELPIAGRFQLADHRWRYALSDGHGLLVCEDVPDAPACVNAAGRPVDIAQTFLDDGPAGTVFDRAALLAWATPRNPPCAECRGTGKVTCCCPRCWTEHETDCESDHAERVLLARVVVDARRLAPLVATLDGGRLRVRRPEWNRGAVVLWGTTRAAMLMGMHTGEGSPRPVREWPEPTP